MVTPLRLTGKIVVLTFLFAQRKFLELIFLHNGKKMHGQALGLLQQYVSRHLPPIEDPKFVRSFDFLSVLARARERYMGKIAAD